MWMLFSVAEVFNVFTLPTPWKNFKRQCNPLHIFKLLQFSLELYKEYNFWHIVNTDIKTKQLHWFFKSSQWNLNMTVIWYYYLLFKTTKISFALVVRIFTSLFFSLNLYFYSTFPTEIYSNTIYFYALKFLLISVSYFSATKNIHINGNSILKHSHD